MSKSFPIRDLRQADLLKLARAAVQNQLKKIEQGTVKLHVPQPPADLAVPRNQHFHFQAELFVQLAGRTHFRFPRESLFLRPGELCLIPKRVAHFETAYPDQGRFFNLIFLCCLKKNTVYLACIMGGEVKPRRPGILKIERFDFPRLSRIWNYLDDLVEVTHGEGVARRPAAKGLLLAFFSRLAEVLARHHSPAKESFKVRQARQLAADHLSEPDLSVKKIAGWLACSPDYLSHLFHQETGTPLARHIIDQRLDQACHLLAESSFNIAEIARAVGFAAANYFSRVFRRRHGQTPRQFRHQLRS